MANIAMALNHGAYDLAVALLSLNVDYLASCFVLKYGLFGLLFCP